MTRHRESFVRTEEEQMQRRVAQIALIVVAVGTTILGFGYFV